MSENVIILGAGFSFDASVPLLGRFVDKMIDIAVKKRCNGKAVSDADAKIISDALEVRSELDAYHGRINFNDRNIEDILSILQFNQLAGDVNAEAKIKAMSIAISKTINLSCTINRTSMLNQIMQKENDHGIYAKLWIRLFSLLHDKIEFPSFITFNYDLVLERSLFNSVIRFTSPNEDRERPVFPYTGLSIEYCNPNMTGMHYLGRHSELQSHSQKRQGGYFLKNVSSGNDKYLQVEILKPHGSLNFDSRSTSPVNDPDICSSSEYPLILPPVFNKMKSGFGEEIWKKSIQRLRNAKTVTIIGYSMPSSDIYMQYFLKAGLGPNRDLDRVTVFDPVLFKDSPDCNEMKERYSKCFSPQLRNRINFNPTTQGMVTKHPGTLEHFVESISKETQSIFF